MKKANKMKILWLSLGIFSAVSAAVGTALVVWLCLGGEYVWAVVAGIFAVHGFYGIPFYFAALWRTRVDLSILVRVGEQVLSVEKIALDTGLTEAAVRARLAICIKRGYLVGYTLTEAGLSQN